MDFLLIFYRFSRVGGGLEEHWRSIGGGLEDWRRSGGGSEEGWRRIGEGLEVDWSIDLGFSIDFR